MRCSDLFVGQVLSQNDDCIAGLCFDAHGSHGWIRNILHGQLDAIPDASILQSIPWFKDPTFLDMPTHNLPRLPVMLAMHGDSPVWGLCGPCDSDFFEAGIFSLYPILIYTYNIIYDHEPFCKRQRKEPFCRSFQGTLSFFLKIFVDIF